MTYLSDEPELIGRARAGDQEAFCALAEAYERRILMLALYYTRNRADAEDLAQELWLKAFRAMKDFRGESSFYTWLRQIMINSFLNHRRAGSNRAASIESAEDGRESARSVRVFDVEENAHRKIMVEKVFGALAELTPQQRLIFLLKHHEGMTYEEIARSLGCSAGTVKKSLFRTVVKLREHLGVDGERVESGEFVPCAAGENL